jgi:hypothetical protein
VCTPHGNARSLTAPRSLCCANGLWILHGAGPWEQELQDVSITALTFGSEFAKAIEQKQVAEQEAERAKFIVQVGDPFLSDRP